MKPVARDGHRYPCPALVFCDGRYCVSRAAALEGTREGTYVRTYGCTGSPCILQEFVPLRFPPGPLPKKEREEKEEKGESKNPETIEKRRVGVGTASVGRRK